jgi:hypothetical protein
MNAVISASRRRLAAHDPPSPDSLARRFFLLAMLGVAACVGLIVALMSFGQ